jgi:hypothetical protein
MILPVSIAEVIVCLTLVGTNFKRLLQPHGKIFPGSFRILAADIFFAFYHFAHSLHLNQLGIVLFLLIIGLVIGLLFFFGRDVYATIIIKNYLGFAGVSRIIDAQYFIVCSLSNLFLGNSLIYSFGICGFDIIRNKMTSVKWIS